MSEPSSTTDFRLTPLRLLLLEDSRFDAELICECLRMHYPLAEPEVVSDEAGFVIALAKGGFDLILSDYELPGYSGGQALEHAQAVTPDTPFIFVSGVIGEDNAVEMLKRGATDYVSKARLSRLPVVVSRALREVVERGRRDRAEALLREANATFARVVDSLHDYAVILLDPQGRIKTWNQGAREVFGYELSQVRGRSAELLFTEEDRAGGVFQAELETALANGKAGDDRWMMRSDGSRLRAEGVVTVLWSERGEHTGFCKVVHDATAAYEDANALRAAKEEAERANRAKDRFLAMLSHELRNPLTPIDSAAHVLERVASVPEKYQGLLPMIRRNVALEARLIDDLLDLTAITAGKMALKMSPVNVHELIRAVIDMVGDQAREKRIDLYVDLQAPWAVVQADEARMQQVLWNIIRNAVKFTPEGGRVHVSTLLKGKTLVVQCTDTGIGIEPQALTRIFTAFDQADSEISKRFGGLGLGLAIARGLVMEHQGTLTATSEGRGKGATFTLSLQSFDPSGVPARQAGSEAVVQEASRNGYNVLLVEDNVDAADAMLLCLQGFGYNVSHATTCASALKAAQESRFDVVVTDLGLPDGSGIDVGQQLSPKMPVIALSGYGTTQDLQRSAQAGFSGHLTKPVDPEAVHSLVQKVLSERAESSKVSAAVSS